MRFLPARAAAIVCFTMKCIVTAGPTYEPLDNVRRLTNLSTGRLGTELANFLTDRGHQVTLLIGEQATWSGSRRAGQVRVFATTLDLSLKLETLAAQPADAVFHAAAVSDFRFGTVWHHSGDGELTEVQAGKITSRVDRLLVEMVPTAKIISHLRGWFPDAALVGWKYEVEGDRAGAVQQGQRQIADCHTNACVVNGPAYGPGFGLVTRRRPAIHLADRQQLFVALEYWAATSVRPRRRKP